MVDVIRVLLLPIIRSKLLGMLHNDGNHKVFAQRPPMDAAVSAGIERLLKTNVQPLDIERTQLENAFVVHTKYAAKLAQRQAQVDAAGRELEAESRVVEEHMSKIKTILHPIRSLPNEVLYEILFPIIRSAIHTPSAPLGLSIQTTYPSSLDVKGHPLWIFSHVCKRWRDHLLSLPRLWSYIYIVLDDKPLNTFKSSFLVRLLVSRSGDQPLHISIQDTNKFLRKSSSLSEVFLHCPRWKTLQLRTRLTSLRILDCGSEDFSLLESIQFISQPLFSHTWSDDSNSDYNDSDTDSDEDEVHTPLPYQGFSHAPNLRRVHLNDPWSTLSPHITFPWNQITHLVLLSIKPPQLAKLLPLMPQLIDAEICLSDKTEASDNIVHDTLRVLNVRGVNSVGPLIPVLRLPALESLSMSLEGDDIYAHVRRSTIYDANPSANSLALQGLMSPTGSCVRALSVTLLATLTDRVSAMKGLVELLGSTPVLESLSIRLIGHESMDHVCSLLHSKLVPRLNHLTIWATHGAEISDILIAMMESRHGELKCVDLRGVTHASDAVLAQLDGIVRDAIGGKMSFRITPLA